MKSIAEPFETHLFYSPRKYSSQKPWTWKRWGLFPPQSSSSCISVQQRILELTLQKSKHNSTWRWWGLLSEGSFSGIRPPKVFPYFFYWCQKIKIKKEKKSSSWTKAQKLGCPSLNQVYKPALMNSRAFLTERLETISTTATTFQLCL